MRILYLTQVLDSGIGIVRAKWPAKWVNKFTEHEAVAMDESDLVYSDIEDIISEFDILVIHKPSYILCEAAKMAKKYMSTVIYDTDDHDDALFGEYYLRAYMQDMKRWRDEIMEIADGVTVTTEPLARVMHQYGKPVAIFPNGYDATLSEYNIQKLPYFEGVEKPWLKIVYGGSVGHARDLEMFFRLGVVEALEEHRIDWFFYGALNGPEIHRETKNGSVIFSPGKDIRTYLSELYTDADILIAPLVQDEFNICRSPIKPIEAGIVGIPAVVTDTESYRNFSPGTYCVQNTKQGWLDALIPLIESEDLRKTAGRENRLAYKERYTASNIINQAVNFYIQTRKP